MSLDLIWGKATVPDFHVFVQEEREAFQKQVRGCVLRWLDELGKQRQRLSMSEWVAVPIPEGVHPAVISTAREYFKRSAGWQTDWLDQTQTCLVFKEAEAAPYENCEDALAVIKETEVAELNRLIGAAIGTPEAKRALALDDGINVDLPEDYWFTVSPPPLVSALESLRDSGYDVLHLSDQLRITKGSGS